jgi:hypothetical protein
VKGEEFVELLEGVRRGFNGWNARCPSHADKTASLSVHLGDDDRVLVQCHAGCTAEEIVAGMGLEMSDLFASNEAPTHIQELGNRCTDRCLLAG